MKRFKFLILLILTSLSISSCADLAETEGPARKLPARFTSENIMKVRQGMSADEIVAMFGEPKSVATNVCGIATKQWNCTTWQYGEFPYERANFTFNDKNGSLRLNNFNIDR